MSLNLTGAAAAGADLVRRVEAESGQAVADCYQCGKCTAGCPVAFAMNPLPHQVVRLLQLGLGEEALATETIWLCSTCATCTTRCPRNIDLARLMDALRSAARQAGLVRAGKNIALFNEIFLDSVRRHGRAHELELGLRRNLRTGRLFQDSDLARGWFLRGRLPLTARKIQGRDEIHRIFEEAARMEDGQ